MKVYLIQHGDSVGAEVNPARPLSEKGKKDIKSLAEFLSKMNLEASHIYHSGKLRAEETAEILSAGIKFKGNIEKRQGLEPLDPVSPIVHELNQVTQNILLAGHMPFMGRLVGALISGDENKPIVAFKPGTIVCLERIESDRWSINWMLCPELF